MSHKSNSDGRIVMNYEGVSYLCESGQHSLCGGLCKCTCHVELVKK